MYKKFHKKQAKATAFTLAEVLITLMIIGVLAIITIPSLMQTFEKMTLKSQVKRALSDLSQALYQTTFEEGDTKCYYGFNATISECPTFYDNFIKKLKIIKKCRGNYTMNNCIPDYDLSVLIPGCSGFNPSSVKNAYILNDGTIIISYGSFNAYPNFWVDVNGIKPPNKPLKDLLVFQIRRRSNGEYYFSDNLGECFNITSEISIYFKYKSDLFN